MPHVNRHARFYLAGLIGLVVLVASRGHPPAFRVVLAGDVFFVRYLALTFAGAADGSW